VVFNSWFGKGKGARPDPTQLLQSIDFARISPGRCVYAVGDVHGMAGLCAQILGNINKDIGKHGLATDVIFLGDMIDRGPESQLVLESITQLQAKSSSNVQYLMLKGNHEQMMLEFLSAPDQKGQFWFRNGGLATLQSYGVYPPESLGQKQWIYLRDEFLERLPARHRIAMEGLPSKHTIGEYFFCHASIKEGQALGEQGDEDLLWSRRFPDDSWGPQEKIVVHGHQPVAEPVVEKFHINVDTGAFATGRLTCVKLCGAERGFMTVSSSKTKRAVVKEKE
jgi:serine/threonine protein phosphatase 1